MNKGNHIFLEKFEGPLALLLHLIEREKIDIYDIPIAEVTKQYLKYIYDAQSLNMDIASEFLVMASKLLAIKAKMLLPKPEKPIIEEDSKEELVARLLEYKRFKELAEKLHENEMLMKKVYSREFDENDLLKHIEISNPVENIEIIDLTNAFKAILKNINEQEPIFEINREQVVLEDCMDEILDQLNISKTGITFNILFTTKKSKLQIVVTFLALLELIKLKKVKVAQNNPFSTIIVFNS
ncbi:condensin subunit ScpA [Desulfonispora thiosulfatigenes DSM 11270]|uniref:Segregation and condensation protein A n=1 Tax=Desulfonispora thiosulfatigenes DSM 11270 TaxID=656914 RepID=A0A1W1VM96_DESTI|nr:segregation/condensation protein A [Desulfonispora thiosulfatigenes]SMB94350.1 condensin subunit ScpA [Desulfonispora thiosulfatigenes DSM 11270]